MKNNKWKCVPEHSTNGKYCEFCGQPPTELPILYPVPLHDVTTGKPLTQKYCTNPKCPAGCYNTYGHVRPLTSFLASSYKCKRCGTTINVGEYE